MTKYNSHRLIFKINIHFSVFTFFFFFFRFYREKVKIVINEDGQSEGMEEQVMVDESDVEETVVSEEGNESKDETKIRNFNSKKYANR